MDYTELATHRKLSTDTLAAWKIAWSGSLDQWIIPTYNFKGKLNQLYKCVPQGTKLAPMASPGFHQSIYGLHLFDHKKPEIYLCEGPWDGMALWELIQKVPERKERINVLAVPGCTTFAESWARIMGGKVVSILYDNDYPKSFGGKEISPAGFTGVRHATRVMVNSSQEDHPKEIRFLQWGGGGYTRDLPDGYDIRDLIQEKGIDDTLTFIDQHVAAIPEDWLKELVDETSVHLQPLYCISWDELENVWRKAMKWTKGLSKTLAVSLASILSTKLKGDPIWVVMMGPPGSAKSTLAEAMSIARRYVIPKSAIKGFVSGYRTDKKGEEDHSLIKRINGKTLIIKDGDTLLRLPNRDEVMSQMRDMYDGAIRFDFKIATMKREYENIRTTIILCGTHSLQEMDSADLGCRFVYCELMRVIDPDLEDAVGEYAALQALRDIRSETNCRADTQVDENMLLAKQMTGGYVEYLRQNAQSLVDEIKFPDNWLMYAQALGKYVSYLRARPPKKQDEITFREFSSRLIKQFTRLSMCLAATLNQKEVDARIMEIIRDVALDTARGRTQAIVDIVAESGIKGMERNRVIERTGQPREKEQELMRFLGRPEIGALECFEVKQTGLQTKIHWRLTERFRDIYNRVMDRRVFDGKRKGKGQRVRTR